MRLSGWCGAICATLIAAQVHAGSEVGDYRGLPADLAAAARAYDIAQFKSDRAELERLLADDYTVVDQMGGSLTKAQDIANALAPDHKTTSVAITKQVVKAWPNGAALGGWVEAKGTDHGKAFVYRGQFVDVWAKRHGRWQVIFTQIDEVAPR